MNPNWREDMKWTPELQEKKRRTFYATRAAWIAAGKPRKSRKLRMKVKLLPKSHREAKEQGKRFYFTGKPCQKGHMAPRKTLDRHCCECRRETSLRQAQQIAQMPNVLAPVTVHRESRYKEIVL